MKKQMIMRMREMHRELETLKTQNRNQFTPYLKREETEQQEEESELIQFAVQTNTEELCNVNDSVILTMHNPVTAPAGEEEEEDVSLREDIVSVASFNNCVGSILASAAEQYFKEVSSEREDSQPCLLQSEAKPRKPRQSPLHPGEPTAYQTGSSSSLMKNPFQIPQTERQSRQETYEGYSLFMDQTKLRDKKAAPSILSF